MQGVISADKRLALYKIINRKGEEANVVPSHARIVMKGEKQIKNQKAVLEWFYLHNFTPVFLKYPFKMNLDFLKL